MSPDVHPGHTRSQSAPPEVEAPILLPANDKRFYNEESQRINDRIDEEIRVSLQSSLSQESNSTVFNREKVNE